MGGTGRAIRTAVLAAAVLSALSGPARAGQAVVVTDSLGRAVEVPGNAARIISLEPEITRIIVALGAGDRLVGIDFFLRHHDHLFPLIAPDSARLPVVSNQGQELDYELALRLRPDIVFASPSEFRMAESIEKKLRVPVVSLASIGRFDALLGEIALLGRILGREERAARLAAFFEERLGPVRRRASASGETNRPSVYLSFWGSLVRTPVAYEPVDVAGGRNVAAGLLPDYLGAAGATVPAEQLVVWDPEVILIQGGYPPAERRVTVEGILRDPRLASVRAVRAGRVHYTFGYWYWWDPALVLVETIYLRRILHPEDGKAAGLAEEAERVFKEFYGVDGAFAALCRILGCDEWIPR
jgi:iron complex transport system substrate-binding protein